MNGKISLFLGDVFVYLNSRDAKEGSAIIREVQGAFERAEQARNADDGKLIVVAHSMGGNISYDILATFAPRIQVDLFVTVGSQVGMFEELKLFKGSDPRIMAPARVDVPKNIKRWINVVDPNDVLAYSTENIFSNSHDTVFDNHVPVWSAHTTYFSRPSFHERMHQRILESLR